MGVLMVDLTTVARINMTNPSFNQGAIMYHYRVEDMTCGHCTSTITKAILATDKQAKVEIDLATKSVKVESTEDFEVIREAIVEAGYSAAFI
jgi:Cu+-exporting ATPase